MLVRSWLAQRAVEAEAAPVRAAPRPAEIRPRRPRRHWPRADPEAGGSRLAALARRRHRPRLYSGRHQDDRGFRRLGGARPVRAGRADHRKQDRGARQPRLSRRGAAPRHARGLGAGHRHLRHLRFRLPGRPGRYPDHPDAARGRRQGAQRSTRRRRPCCTMCASSRSTRSSTAKAAKRSSPITRRSKSRPKQSEIIAVASEMGKLSLSLRSLVAAARRRPAADSPKRHGPGPSRSTARSAGCCRSHSPKRITLGADMVTVLRGNGKSDTSSQVATCVSRSLMRFLPLAGLAGSMIFAVLGGAPAAAQTAAPIPDGRGAVAAAPQNATRPLRGGGASQIAANGAPIVLEVNKGTLIRLTAAGGDGLYRQSRYRRCPGQIAVADLSSAPKRRARP